MDTVIINTVVQIIYLRKNIRSPVMTYKNSNYQ